MHFKYKCWLQTAFSHIPKGHILNYMSQRYVTKTLPLSEADFSKQIESARTHYENFNAHHQNSGGGKYRYYEFGAGAVPVIPLVMSQLGFDVTCIDIRKLIVFSMLRDIITRLERSRHELPFAIKNKLPGIRRYQLADDLATRYNFHYLAPKDARNTEFKDSTFDFITSTSVLEHIPKNDIYLILKECYRILKRGGVASMIIDYKDHWAYFDRQISVYNFLTYSAVQWNRFNPDLHYQNRLRHSDYMKIIADVGFKVIKEKVDRPTQKEMAALKRLHLAAEFASYEINDLGVKGADIVLLKA